MEARESSRDVENLRFRFQMNNRLRLECLAAVSKIFREFGEPIKDELLSSIVFALPQELISSNGHGFARVKLEAAQPGNPPEKQDKEKQDKEKPEKDEPGLPPLSPESEEPGLPPMFPPEPPLPPQSPKPKVPALPPEEPQQAPALPPQQPEQSATEYIA